MHKIFVALTLVMAVGVAMTASSNTPATAEKVVIKTGDRHHHRDRGWHRGHSKKVVIIKRGRRHHHDD